jgi:hypothetical protein
MALPFSYSGSVEVTELQDPKTALLKIEQGLEHLRLRRLVLVGQQLQFSAGTLQYLAGRTALGAAGSGEVTVQRSKVGLTVAYRVRFSQLFWGTLFMVGFCSLFILGAPNLAPREAAALLFGMWAWLYGGNVVVTLFRFPRWLRTTVEPS